MLHIKGLYFSPGLLVQQLYVQWERETERALMIIFIPDRLSKIKSAFAIFSCFFSSPQIFLLLFSVCVLCADDIKEAPRTCFSYSAPVSLNIPWERKNISAALPRLYVCVCVCIMRGGAAQVVHKLIIIRCASHYSCEKEKINHASRLDSAGKWYYLAKVDARCIYKNMKCVFLLLPGERKRSIFLEGDQNDCSKEFILTHLLTFLRNCFIKLIWFPLKLWQTRDNHVCLNKWNLGIMDISYYKVQMRECYFFSFFPISLLF